MENIAKHTQGVKAGGKPDADGTGREGIRQQWAIQTAGDIRILPACHLFVLMRAGRSPRSQMGIPGPPLASAECALWTFAFRGLPSQVTVPDFMMVTDARSLKAKLR